MHTGARRRTANSWLLQRQANSTYFHRHYRGAASEEGISLPEPSCPVPDRCLDPVQAHRCAQLNKPVTNAGLTGMSSQMCSAARALSSENDQYAISRSRSPIGLQELYPICITSATLWPVSNTQCPKLTSRTCRVHAGWVSCSKLGSLYSPCRPGIVEVDLS